MIFYIKPMFIASLKDLAKKILREPLFYLLPLCVLAYLIIIPAKTEISDVKITRNNKTEYIKLPYSVGMPKNEIFFISFNLIANNAKSAKFKIIPDDCIEKVLINEKNFPLEDIKGLCDYGNGVNFDFSKYIQEGSNHFEFRIRNGIGPGGLRVEASYDGFKSLSLMDYIFALFLLLSIALILVKFKFKLIAIAIILLGVIARLAVYTNMGPMQNPFDVGAHLEYAQIISEEKRLPKMDEGWSTYHPPLYYVLSAVVKNIADKYDTSLTNRFLQQWNLLLSFTCVIFGVAFIINLLGNSLAAYLAALVSVFWIGFAIAAPRIGNDSLFYFGALMCMLFAQRYWLFHKSKDMFWATVGAAIALAAKSTGFVILGAWAIIYAFVALRQLKIGSLRTLLVSVFIIALSIGLSNQRSISDILDGKKVSLIGNAGSLNNGLKVQNSAGNYLYLDLKEYLLYPYVTAWQDEGGRQYFWNYAIKTSLYFTDLRAYKTPAGDVFTTIISILALLIFALALWGMMHAKFKDVPPMLFVVSLFAAFIYLRISYPYACSNEFRYIFPALFPLAYFSVLGVQILQDSRVRILSYTALLSFAGLSFVYIIGMAL